MQIWRQKANDRENWVPVVNKARTLTDCRNEQSVWQARGRKNMMMNLIQNQQCSSKQSNTPAGSQRHGISAMAGLTILSSRMTLQYR